MRVLVTGATGFVGARLTEILREKGHSVVAAVRRTPGKTLPHVSYVPIEDFDSIGGWSQAPEGVDCVVHTAARVHIMNEADPDALNAFRRVNVGVTLALAVSTRTFFYMYLQAKWVFWLYKVINPGFRGARPDDFKFASIAKQNVQDVFNASACILDIEHPKQSGLTMRTLETLGAEKKLITTNRDVRSYDFFDERNICVIDRQSPEIPAAFLTSPYVPVPPGIYGRYRLQGWMNEILEVTLR